MGIVLPPPTLPTLYYPGYTPPSHHATVPGTATSARCSDVQGGQKRPWAQDGYPIVENNHYFSLSYRKCDVWYAFLRLNA